MVKHNLNLSVLNGMSRSWPQIVQSPSSTTAQASLSETILDTTLSAFDMLEEALAAVTIGGTISKAWHGVSMNFPSISTYLKELRWITINSSSPLTVTIFPLTGYFSF